jgi:hypothetical protein
LTAFGRHAHLTLRTATFYSKGGARLHCNTGATLQEFKNEIAYSRYSMGTGSEYENRRRTHMRTSLSVVVFAVLVLSAIVTVAQDKYTFHVKSIHKETSDEHGSDKASAIQYLKIVGTFDGKTYTIEAMDAVCNEVLEVGKDYPARLTLRKSDLIIESTFKGRPQKIHWRILTVEE